MEDKTNEVKDVLYDLRDCRFEYISVYNKKVVKHFEAEFDREEIFRPITGKTCG